MGVYTEEAGLISDIDRCPVCEGKRKGEERM